MNNKICTIYSFLNAAKGNWRNSIFIECGECPYGKQKLCSGFLFVPDYNGKPIILSADMIQRITGRTVDKEECQMVIGRQKFESIYALWLDWNINSTKECTISQIITNNACCRGISESCCYKSDE
jgi:hypothetical protein